MPTEANKLALRAALRVHEIGSASPYQLLFAAKGKSGASFGFMQGDLAAGQDFVRETFRELLRNAGFSAAATKGVMSQLSVPLIDNPLAGNDTARVNAALLAGRDLVDAMDEKILTGVYDGLDTCIATAQAAGREIAPEAQLYIAMWINMTGAPDRLLTWLRGGDPMLRRPVMPAGPVVDERTIRDYMAATHYFTENPRNFMHMVESAAVGIAVLRGQPSPIAVPPAAAPAMALAGAAMGAMAGTAPAVQEDRFIYEQATGRMLMAESGGRDLIGTGYSGSEAGGGKNNPHAQCEKDIGPIPRGRYAIGAPFNGPSPFSLRLTPAAENDMCGRDNFLIHGDSIDHPGTASQGCIILKRSEREAISASRIKVFEVVERLI